MDISVIISAIVTFALTIGKNILFAIIILLIGFKLIKLLGKFVDGHHKFSHLEESTRKFLCSLIEMALKILLILTAAIIVGVPTASVIAVLGSAGLAIGLALQGSLSNFAGGILIIFTRPFRIGDFIEAGGVSGTVKEINILYTVLTTGDNKVITIPNGTISNQTVTNVSANPTRRVDFTFSVDYKSDTEQIRKTLISIAEAHPLTLKDPAPVAFLSKHGEDGLEFVLRTWANSGDYWTVFFETNEEVKNTFDKLGINIPYRQLDVHLDK